MRKNLKIELEDFKGYYPPVCYGVYSGKDLLYVGFSHIPAAHIKSSLNEGYWNVLSKYKDIRFVIGLPEDLMWDGRYASLHDDSLPASCDYVGE